MSDDFYAKKGVDQETMRNLDAKTGWRALSRSGRWYLAAAEMFDETKPRVAILQPLYINLEKAGLAVEAADAALLPLRLQCSHRELLADSALRLLHAAAMTADGGKTGTITRTIFPNGLQAEIRLQSASQIQRIDALLTQIDARGWTEQPQLAEAAVRLRTARNALADAVKARGDSYQTAEVAQISLNKAREEFVVAYSTEMGFIRMTYPNDPEQREFFFEQTESRPKKDAGTSQDQPGKA